MAQPKPVGLLNTPQLLQAYLNSCPPVLNDARLYLDGNRDNKITSLEGVVFPPAILRLELENHQITSLKGVQFPPTLTELNLTYNKITSLEGVVFPLTLLTLSLDGNKITSLKGVVFPPGLTYLGLNDNKITSLKGVVFPSTLTDLGLNNNKITSLEGIVFPSTLTVLSLGDDEDYRGEEPREYNQITSLEGVQFPPALTDLNLSVNKITSLKGVQFPPTLKSLELNGNEITSLKGVVFPPGLTYLGLSYTKITSLEGVVFPSTLIVLYLHGNQITSLKGVVFPPTLSHLYLDNNQITSLEGVQFPPTLKSLDLADNPLISLTGMINPSDFVEKTLMAQYPSLYVRDIASEKVKLKPAELSPKTLVKEANLQQAGPQRLQAALAPASQLGNVAQLQAGLSSRAIYKLSMNNRINTITSFLREGMEARSNENAELLKGTSCIKVMIYGKGYLVPFDPTMSVQSVLDYLNDKYYISALVPNCSVMHLNYNGSTLEPEQTLADYNVQVDSQINVKCKIEINYGGKRVKQTIKKSKKRVKKYTNKSIRNYNKVRKI